MINTDIKLDIKDFNYSLQLMLASLIGVRDALRLWKEANDCLEGDAAALRGNLLHLIIDDLDNLTDFFAYVVSDVEIANVWNDGSLEVHPHD